MKKAISFVLAALMLVSAVPTALATNDYTQGTQVVYTATGSESYTITVPASLNPGQSGTVTLDGYWPDSKTVTVTAEKTVTLKNSIKAADTKTLNVTFLGISEAGSNTSKQTFTEPVSVEGISNALFGTWSGKFNYNVDSVEEEVPPAENYIGTVSADNTITLSGVESAGTYTLRYANANGALENYADICSLEVTDPATAVSYDDLIAENCAPVEATSIAVYNAADEKVGDIALGGLKTNLGNKLYSFGALADIHIGNDTASADMQRALTFLTQTENVDFTCIPGDLTNDASDEQAATLLNLINTYSADTPVYLSMGNHDTSSYRGSPVDSERLFNQPLYYSFTQGNDVFIMVGLVRNSEGFIFADGELEWLFETLEENKDKRCLVFQHVFPYDEGCGNAGNFYDFDIWGGIEELSFESMLTHYTNVIHFHGHSHTIFDGQTIDDSANYSNSLGSHSIHIPSLTTPRALTGYYDESLSEGYVIDVYEGGILLRGRDFISEKFLPIGQYYIDTNIKSVKTENVIVNMDLIWENNTILDKTTGVATTNEAYAASQFIDVNKNDTYTVLASALSGIGICCYDENENFLGYIQCWAWSSDAQISTIDFIEGTTQFRVRANVGTAQETFRIELYREVPCS